MRLKIIDIQHTDHRGVRGTSKVGEKYEERKGKCFDFNPDECNLGDCLLLELEDYVHIGLYTTPYEDSYYQGDNFVVETLNSLYICEVINNE